MTVAAPGLNIQGAPMSTQIPMHSCSHRPSCQTPCNTHSLTRQSVKLHREIAWIFRAEHAANLQFGILEVAGTHGGDLIELESLWKELLLTRTFGLNAN